ncbi:NAD-dependent epimerase/dehydratase family protein [Fibrella sp. WM1]|uniref:NAD-dependent epimerase/dehydratase family protein n=1 Tax=Fibrella musci TaxID=3242485 RepID=UPI003522759B
MTILLTGGAGFIGTHLTERLLAQGDTVHIIDNFNDLYDPALKRQNISRHADSGRVYVHEGDLCDPLLLHQLFQQYTFDAVVHLAALPGVRSSFGQPNEYYRVNVLGTQHLLDMMRAHDVRRLVFSSSSSVYGETERQRNSELRNQPAPISPYAQTKQAAEQLCQQYAEEYGFAINCLRFFTVFGPLQRPDMAIYQFLRRILTHQPITIYGDGNASRDFTYVTDVAAGITKALQHWDGFQLYNIGSGTNTTVAQLVQLMEEATGNKAQLTFNHRQPGDVSHTWADLSKASQQLTYTPQVSLAEGVSHMVTWMQMMLL